LKSSTDESRRLFERLAGIISSLDSIADVVVLPMDKVWDLDRELLCERRVISRELASRGQGSGVIVAGGRGPGAGGGKQRVALMINEEDHLRMHVIRPGLDLKSAWRVLDGVDSELEKHVDYAFSAELGYLTVCPSNVGTGMRASVMLHLPGLKLIDEIDRVIAGLNRMGLAVRGTFGEGSEDFGNMYQVSNQTTLGKSEAVIVQQVQSVAERLVELEINARGRLLEKREVYVRDYVSRAFGIVHYAGVMASGEALDLLSALRFGVELDMVAGISVEKLNELMLLIQPGHLQKNAKNALSAEERDILRSQLVGRRLKNIELKKRG
jgi:protein arginine kinase